MDSSIGEVGDSPAEKKITVNVREYGNVVMTSPMVNGQIPEGILEAATSMMDRHTKEIREVLDICGDAEIVENFRIIEGPNVDALMRFKPLGLYGRFASANYDKLAAHFSCHKEHVPDDLTMEFITQMIGRYALQEKMRSEYDEEYDDY